MQVLKTFQLFILFLHRFTGVGNWRIAREGTLGNKKRTKKWGDDYEYC